MPTRILRDGILTSESVDMLTPFAELFYRRLMSVVDDHGRFYAHPALLRASCYPLRLESTTESMISGWLQECVHAGLMRVYSENGKKYLEINNFNQRRRSASKFPAPCPHDDGASAATTRRQRGASADLDVGVVGGEDEGVGDNARRQRGHTSNHTDGLVEWIEAQDYPRPIGNGDGRALISVLNTAEDVATFRDLLPEWIEYWAAAKWSYGLEKYLFDGHWKKHPPKIANPDDEEF